MSAKNIAFNKPAGKASSQTDNWVQSRKSKPRQAKGEIKRLTLELPAELHMRIKVACAQKGQKMVDALLPLLEEQFPKGEAA